MRENHSHSEGSQDPYEILINSQESEVIDLGENPVRASQEGGYGYDSFPNAQPDVFDWEDFFGGGEGEYVPHMSLDSSSTTQLIASTPDHLLRQATDTTLRYDEAETYTRRPLLRQSSEVTITSNAMEAAQLIHEEKTEGILQEEKEEVVQVSRRRPRSPGLQENAEEERFSHRRRVNEEASSQDSDDILRYLA